MPLLWRFLLAQYFRILILSTVSFIAILMTTRFDDIAHFACLGAGGWQIAQFAILQLPYLLPIALPVSSLLTAFLIFRNLSQTHELTAFRACGLSLKAIITPLALGAAFVATFNFYLASELAPAAHLNNGLLRHQLRGINPLLLLSNKRLLQTQGIYGEALGSIKHGKWAHEVFLALPPGRQGRLRLITAQRLEANTKNFIGHDVTLIGGQPSKEGGFDQLLIENIAYLDTPLNDFSPFLKQKMWSLHPDHLHLTLLLAGIREESSLQKKDPSSQGQKRLYAAYTEIARRLSLALAVFTFTLLGAAYGIYIGRHPPFLPVIAMGILAALYLIAYFLSKSLEDRWQLSVLLLLVPHLVIAGATFYRLRFLNQGTS